MLTYNKCILNYAITMNLLQKAVIKLRRTKTGLINRKNLTSTHVTTNI